MRNGDADVRCSRCGTVVARRRSLQRWLPWITNEAVCPTCGQVTQRTHEKTPPSSDDREVEPDPATGLDMSTTTDWTTTPASEVAPWRRTDRELLDQARAANLPGQDEQLGREATVALARELRRLAGFHADGALSNEEFIAGIKARLTDADG